jgi:hypothetical protein
MSVELSNAQKILVSERIYNTTCKTCREFEVFFNGKKIPLNSMVADDKNNMIYLKDIIKSNSIIFRFSELHCNTCIDFMIENLIKDSIFIGIENIVLLSSSTSPNYVYHFKKAKGIKFPMYKLTPNLEELFMDIDIPYCFVIEKSAMRINSVFVPQKENPELTNKYLQNLIKEYFN